MKFVPATKKFDRGVAEFFPPGNKVDRGRMKFGVGRSEFGIGQKKSV